RATHEASVATYRQTVLAAFQAVEDNLAALRILEEEARVQDGAVKFAQESVAVITNEYKAGTVTFLNVITAQTAALGDERTAIGILGSRMVDTVLLIEALGGGWSGADLPSAEQVTRGG
ncbi:MAG TPA: TolC family protein, partial [Candidatus Binatia bacterium]|nr:TolC family protein [Candidatus Binatia bacterium]